VTPYLLSADTHCSPWSASGKTTVAKLFGRILNAVGARTSNTFVEVNAQQVLSAGEEAFGEMVQIMLNPKPSPEAVLEANKNELRLLADKQANNVKAKQEDHQKDEGGLQQRHDAAVKKLSDDANAALDALCKKGMDLAKHQEKDQQKDLDRQGTERNDLRQKQNREKSAEDQRMVTVQQELDQAQADLQQAQALASYNSPNTAAIAAAANRVRDKQTTMRSVQTQQAATKERHQDEQAGVREKHQSEDRRRQRNHDQQKEELKAEKDQLREKTDREKADMREAHRRESDALKIRKVGSSTICRRRTTSRRELSRSSTSRHSQPQASRRPGNCSKKVSMGRPWATMRVVFSSSMKRTCSIQRATGLVLPS